MRQRSGGHEPGGGSGEMIREIGLTARAAKSVCSILWSRGARLRGNPFGLFFSLFAAPLVRSQVLLLARYDLHRTSKSYWGLQSNTNLLFVSRTTTPTMPNPTTHSHRIPLFCRQARKKPKQSRFPVRLQTILKLATLAHRNKRPFFHGTRWWLNGTNYGRHVPMVRARMCHAEDGGACGNTALLSDKLQRKGIADCLVCVAMSHAGGRALGEPAD